MINSVCGIRSTGRICTDLADALEKQGHEVKIAYGREEIPDKYRKYGVRIGSNFDVTLHGIKSRLFDKSGMGSKSATKKFIEWVRKFDPDAIHLHNIHGYYINIEVLFSYLKSFKKQVIWTLHDCWAFTGHCTYFSYIECNKWKTGCFECPQKREYPSSLVCDFSSENYRAKRELFSGIEKLEIVTPSKWLAFLVKDSFLKCYNTTVINNGVDGSVFTPKNGNVRKHFNLENKKVILGVAAVWNKRKGLDTFIKLSRRLDDAYRIILVGLSSKQIKKLPPNIIGIERTNNSNELAELYSIADIFVNPTLEDNYPTTNIEAIACGTPVITYKTGGSPESARGYGIVVEKNDVESLLDSIERNIFYRDPDFYVDKEETVKRYLKLYNGEC